jgi:hypothetical protein
LEDDEFEHGTSPFHGSHYQVCPSSVGRRQTGRYIPRYSYAVVVAPLSLNLLGERRHGTAKPSNYQRRELGWISIVKKNWSITTGGCNRI